MSKKSAMELAARSAKLAEKTRKKVERSGGLERVPNTCGECNRWKYFETDGARIPMCTHPKSFDKSGTPMFLMLEEEPPEYCGIRRRQFFTMMEAANEARKQGVTASDLQTTNTLPPGTLLSHDGGVIDQRPKGESASDAGDAVSTKGSNE